MSFSTAETQRRREKLENIQVEKSPRLRVSAVSRCGKAGFTLIELLLVLLLIALIASLVAPVVTGGIQRAREATLKEDLYTMRKAIDDYYADTGSYPADLDDLVKKRYLRRIPPDPMTEKRDTWQVVAAEEGQAGKPGGIVDVRSGSPEQSSDGTYFKDW